MSRTKQFASVEKILSVEYQACCDQYKDPDLRREHLLENMYDKPKDPLLVGWCPSQQLSK